MFFTPTQKINIINFPISKTPDTYEGDKSSWILKITQLLKFTSEHPYHLVDTSPWPLFFSILLCGGLLINILFFNRWNIDTLESLLVLAGLILSFCNWLVDVIVESSFEGNHTFRVRVGIKMGFILFILSEIMLFFSFFWSFFFVSLVPVIWIGGVWPPFGLVVPNPWTIPLVNTLLLLFSGSYLTWCHYSVLLGKRRKALESGLGTVTIGVIFIFLQFFEYVMSKITMSTSIYGSIFYIATGFHGLHVIVGIILIMCGLQRLVDYRSSADHHIGFELAIWYWHWVDIVWLFLFVSIYWWGK